jgi:hypothetical protein
VTRAGGNRGTAHHHPRLPTPCGPRPPRALAPRPPHPALATRNAGADAATEWVFAHMEDPDFNDPLPPPGGAPAASGGAPAADPEAVSSLTAMGFGSDAAEAALGACGGSLERAADWLFSHMDDLDAAVAAAKTAVAGGSDSAGGGVAAAGGSGGTAAPAKCVLVGGWQTGASRLGKCVNENTTLGSPT